MSGVLKRSIKMLTLLRYRSDRLLRQETVIKKAAGIPFKFRIGATILTISLKPSSNVSRRGRPGSIDLSDRLLIMVSRLINMFSMGRGLIAYHMV
jgi:hypothetical protein